LTVAQHHRVAEALLTESGDDRLRLTGARDLLDEHGVHGRARVALAQADGRVAGPAQLELDALHVLPLRERPELQREARGGRRRRRGCRGPRSLVSHPARHAKSPATAAPARTTSSASRRPRRGPRRAIAGSAAAGAYAPATSAGRSAIVVSLPRPRRKSLRKKPPTRWSCSLRASTTVSSP